MKFEITEEAIDPVSLKAELDDDAAGACATFEGWVRDHNEGETVSALEYEAHAAIASTEGNRIIDEALDRFDVIKASGVRLPSVEAIAACASYSSADTVSPSL